MSSNAIGIRLSLATLALPRVGRKTAPKILAALGDQIPEDAGELRDAIESADTAGRRIPAVNLADTEFAFASADRILEECDHLDIRIVGRGDESLPEHFWGVSDPPFILYLRGSTVCVMEAATIGIIGTRKPTEYGQKAGHRFGLRCAEAGLVVVSGLAIGCDTAAHTGCLEASGRAVAAMAHGLDSVHPARNRELAARIVDEGGFLLSEYPPGAKPRPNQFVERDRLQSALSHGLIVVETNVKGGTMHTVGFARDQGRLLACLAHPEHLLSAPQTRGNQKLIRDGSALALANAGDLESFIEEVKSTSTRPTKALVDGEQGLLWDEGTS